MKQWCPLYVFLYSYGLTLIPAWISNNTHYNVWDVITYPFLNFNGCTLLGVWLLIHAGIKVNPC